MSIIQSIILGITQGLTEFFPVSSSGHLVIAQKLIGIKHPPVFFDILIHFATMSAIIFFFRHQISKISKNLLAAIIVGTLPTGIIGLILNQYKTILFNSLPIAATGLIITSLLLTSTLLIKKKNLKTNTINTTTAIAIGVTQAIAIIPGISRSATTIVTGQWLGLSIRQSFTFSFLLSIPSITAALMLQLQETNTLNSTPKISFIVGSIAAACAGFIALKFLKIILSSQKLHYFAIYTISLAAISILLVNFPH